MLFSKYKIITILIIAFLLITPNASAYNNIKILRDDETEILIKDMLNPLFNLADMKREDVNIYIIKDSSLNAFVTAGNNIFINTGLILKYKNPDVIMGVMAHELSHITLGHHVKNYEDYKRSQKIAIVSTLAGVVAAGAGSPEAAQTLIVGGQHAATQSLFSYSRIKEEAADQKAIDYLDKVQMNASSLVDIMQDLQNEESLIFESDEVIQTTHPEINKRISYIQNSVKNSQYSNEEFNAKYQQRLDMVQAKLFGYLMSKNVSQLKLNKKSDSFKYAEAVFCKNKGEYKKALASINDLIKQYKDNPYFYEIRGEVYYNMKKYNKAIKDFNKAITLNDEVIFTRLSSTQAIYKYNAEAKKDNELINQAINQLNYVIEKESNPYAYYLLSQIYHLDNNKVLSFYNLAEYNLAQKKYKNACKYINMSSKALKQEEDNDTGMFLRIQDFRESIEGECS